MVIVITLLCGCDTAYIQSSETAQSSELCDTRDSCVDFACYPKIAATAWSINSTVRSFVILPIFRKVYT